eukprot:2266514-Rhodomonas_salina.2
MFWTHRSRGVAGGEVGKGGDCLIGGGCLARRELTKELEDHTGYKPDTTELQQSFRVSGLDCSPRLVCCKESVGPVLRPTVSHCDQCIAVWRSVPRFWLAPRQWIKGGSGGRKVGVITASAVKGECNPLSSFQYNPLSCSIGEQEQSVQRHPVLSDVPVVPDVRKQHVTPQRKEGTRHGPRSRGRTSEVRQGGD